MVDKKDILLIDDELEIGEVLTELIQPVYHGVQYASTPEKAQELLQHQPFHLIISDVNMPNIPGPELMRIVRSQGNLCPVMFLTGYANKETVLSALRLGAADVIEKPFDSDQLLNSIARVLETEKRKRQLIIDLASKEVPTGTIEKQKKMLGLLYVTNEKKGDKKKAG